MHEGAKVDVNDPLVHVHEEEKMDVNESLTVDLA